MTSIASFQFTKLYILVFGSAFFGGGTVFGSAYFADSIFGQAYFGRSLFGKSVLPFLNPVKSILPNLTVLIFLIILLRYLLL